MNLTERKQLQARERIVRAANDLFRERGFAAVSVTDIVERAEVGRTSFFRYFGDKQEVVFAHEQAVIDAIGGFYSQNTSAAPTSLAEALAQLRTIVVALCAQVTTDGEDFTRHYALVDANPDLRARDALKAQRLARLLADILVQRGAGIRLATLAAQLALACYQAARLSAGHNARALVAETEVAFDQVVRLGDHVEG